MVLIVPSWRHTDQRTDWVSTSREPDIELRWCCSDFEILDRNKVAQSLDFKEHADNLLKQLHESGKVPNEQEHESLVKQSFKDDEFFFFIEVRLYCV